MAPACFPHLYGSNMAMKMTSRSNRVARMISVGILIASIVMPANAETMLITRAGAWQAFGGTTANGQPVCGVSQSASDRYFGLKYYARDSTFTVQIGAKGWRLENGAKQKLQMVLDGNRPWGATAAAMHFGDGDAGLEFTISRAELDQFAAQFRNSGSLRVQFTDWDQEAWTLSLAGSNAVTDAFLQCIVGIR
jgi:hypothetical protein